MSRRDFRGYGDRPPDPRWPGDSRLAVSVVVNVEEGAELSLADGDERNEFVHEVVEEVVGAPDLCMESHFEYGVRAGYWRIAELLDRFDVKATFSASARALERSPWLARDIRARGHEISAHSYRWERHAHLDEAAERAVIGRAVAAIEAAVGARPVGWHTRSSPSPNTRRLLVEDGGFLYDSDAYNDDLPYLVDVAGRSHIVVPYAFDTNDMRFTRQVGLDRRLVGLADLVQHVADLVRPAALDGDVGKGRGQGGEQARAAVDAQHLQALAGQPAAHQVAQELLPLGGALGGRPGGSR